MKVSLKGLQSGHSKSANTLRAAGVDGFREPKEADFDLIKRVRKQDTKNQFA